MEISSCFFLNFLDSSNSDSNTGTANQESLPNPWGGTSNSGSTATTTGTSNTSSNAGTGGPFGSFNTAGMNSLMAQMAENPQLMQNMMNAPYTQSMMQVRIAKML